MHFAILEYYGKYAKTNVGFQKIYIFYKKKINPKYHDVFHNICRVRDSENNKKRNIVLVLKLQYL